MDPRGIHNEEKETNPATVKGVYQYQIHIMAMATPKKPFHFYTIPFT